MYDIIYHIYHVSYIMYHPLPPSHPPAHPPHHQRYHQHQQVFCTTNPLQHKPFTQETLYNRSPLLHQKVFTPRMSLHHQHFLSETKAFHAKHLLCPYPFYTKHLLHRKPFVLHVFATLLAQKQERFTPETFCTTPLLPEALCITRLLHQKPFAPQAFYTRSLLRKQLFKKSPYEMQPDHSHTTQPRVQITIRLCTFNDTSWHAKHNKNTLLQPNRPMQNAAMTHCSSASM